MPEFEWDDDKASANFAKHGVSFETAAQAFRDTHALEFEDDRENYGEERRILLGMTDGTVLTVVFVERGEELIRIISARRATKNEQDRYFRQEHG